MSETAELPTAAAPDSAPEAVTKRTRRAGPRKDLFPGLTVVEGKPTLKLPEPPEIGEGEGQFNPAKHRKLTEANFVDKVPYCRYMSDLLRTEARSWSSQAEELAKLGTKKERDAVANYQKMQAQLLEMSEALAAQGITMEKDPDTGKSSPVAK